MNEYENSLCRYCEYRNSWDCSEGCYPVEGCENWCLDSCSLSEEQKSKIRGTLLSSILRSDYIF